MFNTKQKYFLACLLLKLSIALLQLQLLQFYTAAGNRSCHVHQLFMSKRKLLYGCTQKNSCKKAGNNMLFSPSLFFQSTLMEVNLFYWCPACPHFIFLGTTNYSCRTVGIACAVFSKLGPTCLSRDLEKKLLYQKHSTATQCLY